MKERLDEQTIALRVAKEFQDGWYVNLGYGIPTLASNFVSEGRTVIFQAENGLLGYGPTATIEQANEMGWSIVNAGSQPVLPLPGMYFCDYGEAFEMIRGRHLDLSVLGGLQVSEKGDLANWSAPGETTPVVGGAMDLAIGAKRIIVAMKHTDKKGRPRILKECSYPLTARECVNLIITDLAVIEVTKQGLVITEVAPNWTVEEVQALTEPKLMVADDVREIEL